MEHTLEELEQIRKAIVKASEIIGDRYRKMSAAYSLGECYTFRKQQTK